MIPLLFLFACAKPAPVTHPEEALTASHGGAR